MPVEKELGKLTPDQFHRLVKTLPELRKGRDDITKVMRDNPQKLKEILGLNDHTWAEIYEFPFVEQIAFLVIMVGLHEKVIEVGRSEDPQESALRWGDEDSALDQWLDDNEEKIEFKRLIWLATVLQRNILAIMLFHCSMGHLVEQARNGDDDALFHAVEIDRSSLTCPTFADRLARAELTNDKLFFLRLRKALKGPSKKHMVAIQDLRYSIVALRSMGFDQFTDKDLEQLFIRTRLYPNSAGALKNLRKHIQAARKLQPPEL